MNKFLGLLCVLVLATPIYAKIDLNPDRPDSYTVVRGDTLWSISAKFLRDPWKWPEIWYINKSVQNPHLIFPGDLLHLVVRDGKLVIEVTRGPDSKEITSTSSSTDTSEAMVFDTPSGVLKILPRARPMNLDDAIPPVPMEAVRPFLNHTRVVSKHTLDKGPYIVGTRDGRILSGANEEVYARGMKKINGDHTEFRIYRKSAVYRNSRLGFALGYEAMYIGSARLLRAGDPAKLKLLSTTREVMPGDRLLPATEVDSLAVDFIPHSPKAKVKGKIVAVLDGVSRIGQYQVVAINLGARDQMEQGHVLAIEQSGHLVRDRLRWAGLGLTRLPSEKVGLLMVFRTFEKVSYALVMTARGEIKVSDLVLNP